MTGKSALSNVIKSFSLLFILFFLFSCLPSVNARTISQTFADNVRGRIVLNVEGLGEAYYVDPYNLNAYYLGRPDDAFQIMRNKGLGITNNDLAKIPTKDSNETGDLQLRIKLSGKILLQVEENGEAWYVFPGNNKRYYLGRPADAFKIMRELGLGISTEDLNILPKDYNPQPQLKCEQINQSNINHPLSWKNESSGPGLMAGKNNIIKDNCDEIFNMDSRSDSNYYMEKAHYMHVLSPDDLNIILNWSWKQERIEEPYGLVSTTIIFLNEDVKFSRSEHEYQNNIIGVYEYRHHTGDFQPYDCSAREAEHTLTSKNAYKCIESIANQFPWQQETNDIKKILNEQLTGVKQNEIKSIKVLITSYNNAGSGADAYWRNFDVKKLNNNNDTDANTEKGDNWGIYSNNLYTISYPKEWRHETGSNNYIYSYQLHEIENPGRPVSSERLKIQYNIYDDLQYDNVSDWVGSLNNVIKSEDITIDNKTAKMVWRSGEIVSQILTVYYFDSDKGLGVNFTLWPYNSQYFETFKNIVKSFKFN